MSLDVRRKVKKGTPSASAHILNLFCLFLVGCSSNPTTCFEGTGQTVLDSMAFDNVPLSADRTAIGEFWLKCSGYYQVLIGFNPKQPENIRITEDNRHRYFFRSSEGEVAVRDLDTYRVHVRADVTSIDESTVLESLKSEMEIPPYPYGQNIMVISVPGPASQLTKGKIFLEIDGDVGFFYYYSTVGLSLRFVPWGGH